MAKMKSKLFYKYYTKKANDLSSKIKFIESYTEVYKELLEEKAINKLNKIKRHNIDRLGRLKKKAYTKEEYFDIYSKKPFEKLAKKNYWQKRALNHKFDKLENKGQSSEDLRKLELEKLEEKYENKKSNITSKYSLNISDEKRASSTEKYNQKENKLENKVETLERKLIEKNKINNDKHQEKSKKQIEKLKIKHQIISDKLVEITNDIGAIYNIENEENILEIKNLTMQFGGLKAVDNLSFNVKEGEIFGLIGPNGAGKTTVFNCLTQFYKPKEGVIYYRNSDNNVVKLNDFKVHDVINQGIARTFQNVELIFELTVLDNMLLGAHSSYKTGFFQHVFNTRRFKREEATIRSKAIKILTDLEIIDYAYAYPMGLPYGILKKIELARTLMTNPNLIILDEPAAGLNEFETQELAKTIKKIQKDYACTIFLVEHDMGLVMDICDTICAISFGKKLAIGTPSEIQNNEIVKEAYLGGE